MAIRIPQRLKVKRGDTVRVLRGKDRGKEGKIMRVLPEERRVVVENIQMVVKFIRPRRQGEKTQRVNVASAIPVSNVQLICQSCKKGTRVGSTVSDGKKVRICKKCQAHFA
jgi:large subunit ribosomal protein L24